MNMRQMDTHIAHIAHLPNAYRCAVEQFANGDRTESRMKELCDFYATSNALIGDEHHAQWSFDAWCIAKRRYAL